MIHESGKHKRQDMRAAAVLLLCTLCAPATQAADAVAIQLWDEGPGLEALGPGGMLSAVGMPGNNSAYTDNPNLNYSSWAHTGAWWNFELTGAATTTITLQAQSGQDFWPAMSIWASGDQRFDGGTTGFGNETSSASFGTPHSFNATGAMGNPGTLWMSDGEGGNMLETLAYAVSHVSVAGGYGAATPTGWGERIDAGVHDVSLDDLFESGISGHVTDHLVEVVLADLQPGWYTIYVGGSNHASAGGLFDLSVSAVPVPAAVYLLAPAILGLFGIARGRSRR
ncbi:MAG: pyruvate-binding protein [Gammaproteobacteria bacterium]|nr:pyruvate-binding protein [Gammaproteobacteria bacterium]